MFLTEIILIVEVVKMWITADHPVGRQKRRF